MREKVSLDVYGPSMVSVGPAAGGRRGDGEGASGVNSGETVGRSAPGGTRAGVGAVTAA